MNGRTFDKGITRCPWLPAVERVVTARETRAVGAGRGEEFYLAALRFAHSLWLEGKPAQAILQFDKAWMADLCGDEPVIRAWPAPYRPMRWMLTQAGPGQFLGNPVRHFQHLATRMSGPRSELRRWRAWACFHLAEQRLPAAQFPRDIVQVEREGVRFPAEGEVCLKLARLGWVGEAQQVAELLGETSGCRS